MPTPSGTARHGFSPDPLPENNLAARTMAQRLRELPMQRAFGGVGARKTPAGVLRVMEEASASLARKGWTLWSGGAEGADQAFETGHRSAEGRMRIFLPCLRFKGHVHPHSQSLYVGSSDPARWAEAKNIARTVWSLHAERCGVAPWTRLRPFVRKFMTRNMFQVLGPALDRRAAFLLCWTPDACLTWEERSRRTGGTGQAIALASLVGVPVFNLRRQEHMQRISAGAL